MRENAFVAHENGEWEKLKNGRKVFTNRRPNIVTHAGELGGGTTAIRNSRVVQANLVKFT